MESVSNICPLVLFFINQREVFDKIVGIWSVNILNLTRIPVGKEAKNGSPE